MTTWRRLLSAAAAVLISGSVSVVEASRQAPAADAKKQETAGSSIRW